jgi:hypothetical protein
VDDEKSVWEFSIEGANCFISEVAMMQMLESFAFPRSD